MPERDEGLESEAAEGRLPGCRPCRWRGETCYECLRGQVGAAQVLVARCYLAIRFLHDAGAVQWLGAGELAEYEAYSVTVEDLEQHEWLKPLAEALLRGREEA